MTNHKRSEAINGLLVFLIYGMFALFALFLVVIGARVYKNVVTTGDSNAAVRTGFCYISNKVRMYGGQGSVSLEEHEGCQVLTLRSLISDGEYETRIFYSDGVLWEQFAPAAIAFDPEDGEKIVALPAFSMADDGAGGLCLSASAPDGLSRSMRLNCLEQEGRP